MSKTEALISEGQDGRVGVARRLVLKEHGRVARYRRTGERDICHIERVAIAVSGFGDRYTIVAWLHDTLEDTGLPPEVISGMFGEAILDDVLNLTRDEERETYREYINRLCLNGTLCALRVKLADLNDNMNGPDEEWHRRLMRRYEPAHAQVSAEIARRYGRGDR